MADFGPMRSSRHSGGKSIFFEVNMRSSLAGADCIVPLHLYRQGVHFPWNQWPDFTSMFDDGAVGEAVKFTPFNGTVAEVSVLDQRGWPQSPYESLSVTWSDGQLGRLSPWEATPALPSSRDRSSEQQNLLEVLGCSPDMPFGQYTQEAPHLDQVMCALCPAGL
jgi:hypothetical protein